VSREIAWLSERESDDPGRLRSDEDDTYAVARCDHCGLPLLGGAKSLAGVGIACSDKCLNAICLLHEQFMDRR
jgi:hypothetical protein